MGRPDHVSLIDIQIKCAQPTITDEWLISKTRHFMLSLHFSNEKCIFTVSHYYLCMLNRPC